MARRGKSRPKRIPVDGSELCLQCGLCCDGTLFTNITLKPSEHAYAQSLGLAVNTTPDGGLGAPQPCSAFVDGCCSLYAVGRPAACGSYRCELLKAYAAGTRNLDEVLPVVHLVRSLAREL